MTDSASTWAPNTTVLDETRDHAPEPFWMTTPRGHNVFVVPGDGLSAGTGIDTNNVANSFVSVVSSLSGAGAGLLTTMSPETARGFARHLFTLADQVEAAQRAAAH